MNKYTFLEILRKKLNGLPEDDINERLTFYSEIIDDKIEEGIPEEEAVAQLGTIENIVSQIMFEIPLSRLVKEKVKPNRVLKIWEIILLILGSPLWFSLLIAVFSVLISLYAVIWTFVITLWAVEFTLIACSFSGIAATVIVMLKGNITTGLFLLGSALICAGISIFGFYSCKLALKGILILSKKIFLGIKSCFISKEVRE